MVTTRRTVLRAAIAGLAGAVLAACGAPTTPPAAKPAEAPKPTAEPTAPSKPAAEATKPAAATAAPAQATAAPAAPTATAAQAAAKPTAAPAAGAVTQLAPAKLVWWTNDGKLGDRVKPVEEEFTKKYPQVQVEDLVIAVPLPEKLAPAAAAGTLPDLYYARTFTTADHSIRGWLADITDYVKRDAKDVNVDDLEPVMTVKEQWKGKWYSQPENYSVIVVYYNKKLFDEAKVPYPKDDWTWNDFLDTAAKFNKNDGSGKQSQFGAETSALFANWINFGYLKGNGGEVVSDDFKKCLLNSKENADSLQFLSDMIHVHKVAPAPGQLPQGVNPFFSGICAMSVGGSWAIPAMRDGIKDKFDWDVAALPKGSTGKYGVNVEGGCYGVSSTKNKDQSWELVKFATSNYGIETMVNKLLFSLPGRVSNREGWLKSATSGGPPKHSPVYFDMLKNVPAMVPSLPYWEEFIKVFGNRIGPVQAGEKKAADVLPALAEEVNKVIANATF
jgi:multiple sugar transport system substrate-binding protein